MPSEIQNQAGQNSVMCPLECGTKKRPGSMQAHKPECAKAILNDFNKHKSSNKKEKLNIDFITAKKKTRQDDRHEDLPCLFCNE